MTGNNTNHRSQRSLTTTSPRRPNTPMTRTIIMTTAVVLSGALAVSAVGCGGAKAPRSASQPTGMAPQAEAAPDTASAIPTVRVQERKKEIEALLGEIGRLRQEAGLGGAAPSSDAIAAGLAVPMSEAIDACPEADEPDTPRCQDVCKLGDSICDNAERICRISDELVGDEWAQNKCSSAKVSCKEAKQSCCGCR